MRFVVPALLAAVAALGGYAIGRAETALRGPAPGTQEEATMLQVNLVPTYLPMWAFQADAGPEEPGAFAAAGQVVAIGSGVGELPSPLPTVSPTLAGAWPDVLTADQMHAVLTAAGWPDELHEDAMAVALCESSWSPGAIGDHGASLGLFQLWHGWFVEGEDAMDALTNARVALRVRQARGRFGGGGGWTCADLLGIR